MTNLSSPPEAMPGRRPWALLLPMAVHGLLHHIVVLWLTWEAVSRVGLLETRMFTVAGIEVRLSWMVTALIVLLAVGTHVGALCVDDVDFSGLATGMVLTHLPAVLGSWPLIWGDGVDHPGDLIWSLLWSVLAVALIMGGSFGLVSAGRYLTGPDDYDEGREAGPQTNLETLGVRPSVRQ